MPGDLLLVRKGLLRGHLFIILETAGLPRITM